MPSWPSTVSLPSPGSHWKTSSPAPSSARSLPLSPSDEVVAVAAEQDVGALAAEDGVVAGAAVDRQLDDPAGRVAAVMRSSPPSAVDDERIVGALGVRDVHQCRQADHGDRASPRRTRR